MNESEQFDYADEFEDILDHVCDVMSDLEDLRDDICDEMDDAEDDAAKAELKKYITKIDSVLARLNEAASLLDEPEA